MKKILINTLVFVLIVVLPMSGISCGSSIDGTPPEISVVSATEITETGAVISWTTDEPATSQIEYGLTATYGSASALIGTLVNSHTVTLTGLASQTTYHFRVISKDEVGNQAVSNDSIFATPDATPPAISDVLTVNITASSATITWTTNEPATSQVEYGVTPAYSSASALNSTLVNSHSVTLTGLAANTTYHFRLQSKDSSGNLALSEDYTFATPIPVPSAEDFLVTISARKITLTNNSQDVVSVYKSSIIYSCYSYVYYNMPGYPSIYYGPIIQSGCG